MTGYGSAKDAPQQRHRVRTAHPGDRIQLVPIVEAEKEPTDHTVYWGPGAFGWGMMDGTQRGLGRVKPEKEGSHC